MGDNVYPVLLNVESTEFTNQIDIRASVYHGFGNVTGVYIAAFSAGNVSNMTSTNPDLKNFMTTNLTNLIAGAPVVIYDQKTIETTLEVAYDGLSVTANVDIDSDTTAYDICLLAVGHKQSDGTETHAFTSYQNERASHLSTVSSLPAFVSGTVSINNAFVDANTTVRGKRRQKGEIVSNAAVSVPIEMKMYFLNHNPNGNNNHNLISHILMYDTPDALAIVQGTSVTLQAGASHLLYTVDFIHPHSGIYNDPLDPNLEYDSTVRRHYNFDDTLPSDTLILTLKNISPDLKSVYVLFDRSGYAFDYRLEFYVNGTYVPELDYTDTTQSSKTSKTDGATIYNSLRDGAYGYTNVDFSTSGGGTTSLTTDQFELTSANVTLQDGDTTNYAYVFGATGGRPLTLYERLDFLARDDIVVQSETSASSIIAANLEASVVEIAYSANTNLANIPLTNVYDSVRDQIVPSWSVNTGYVHIVGTNSNDLANINDPVRNNAENVRFNTQTVHVPISSVPSTTMLTDACAQFGNVNATGSEQWLRLLKQGRWQLDPSNQSWTIGFWIKLDSTDTSSVRHVFSFGDADFVVNPTGIITFNGQTFESTGILANDTWKHVVVVRTHSQSTLQLYVDNVEIISSSGTLSVPSTTDFTIGKGNATPGYMPYTELDDFVVYRGTALDTNQVNSLYTQGAEYVYNTSNYDANNDVIDTAASALSPYAFWKFDKDGLLNDTSENNHHLKRTGVNIGNTSIIAQKTTGLKTDDFDSFVNDPYIVLANVETNPASNTLDILEGSLFSSFADIERYHVFAFDTSNVAESLLTRANVIDFANNVNLQTQFLADGPNHVYNAFTGTGNVVMYTGSNVPRYAVELLNNNVQLTHAFTTLTPSGNPGNDVVRMTSGGSYKPYVYALDADGRTIGTAAEPEIAVLAAISIANIEIYMKNPSSTTGFVTTDPILPIYLHLSEIRLYSEHNWQGNVIPYTVSYYLPGGDYQIQGTGTYTSSVSNTVYQLGMQDGYWDWYRWHNTTLTTTYQKILTLVPDPGTSSVGSLKLYAGRVKYGPDVKIVYNTDDGQQIIHETLNLQSDSRFDGEIGHYPDALRDWNASIDFSITSETYYDTSFNVEYAT